MIIRLLLACYIAIGLSQPEAALGKDRVIDLTRSASGDLVIVTQYEWDQDDLLWHVQLPKFHRFCHVAAESKHFRWIGASNRMFPWVGQGELTSIYRNRNPTPPSIVSPNRRAFLMLFELADGRFLCVMPVAGEHSVSWLETEEDGRLVVGAGTLGKEPIPADADVPLLVWSVGDDPYRVLYDTWAQVIESRISEGNTRWRSSKTYPEELHYLGWCTWEQYHHNISEKTIVNAIQKIERSKIPVRWVLIDDGHQQEVGRRMRSLAPSTTKFPRGWTPVIAAKKADHVKWIGVWHTLLMNWNTIDASHDMASLSPYLMRKPGIENSLIPRDNKGDSRSFYEEFMKQVDLQGFDFVKMDNMSRSTTDYYGARNAAEAQKNNVRSLEEACNERELGLMNCSAQNTIGILNAKYSATMRTSPDYKKGNLQSSKSQILQSVFNVSWLGQTLWPDHDMFHSSDTDVAETMAITKAMSGGPIYLSDDPLDFNKSVVLPLCYKDGLLIRPTAPGAPVRESLFSDALYEVGQAYKVVAPLNDGSCAVAAYNLSLRTSTASGVIGPSDYSGASAMLQPYAGPWQRPSEGLIVYDWDQQRGELLSDDGVSFDIQGFGHRLFHLIPVRFGWAVVGRPDKYLSPATVQVDQVSETSLVLSMYEPAPVLIYSKNGVPHGDDLSVEFKGNNFYLCSFGREATRGSIMRIDVNHD